MAARKQNHMKWIDEMFVGMEKDRAEESARRSANAARADRTEHRKERIPGALEAWSALVSSITNDVNDFNQHKQRAGQTPARISQDHFNCEVYLPGMHGTRLVLTLDNHALHVTVHPDFPRQPSTITLKLDKAGQHGVWVLGEPAQQNSKLSMEQLSEYLLKPVLSAADFN